MKIVILLLAVTVLALPALAQEKKMAAKPAKGASVEAAVKGLQIARGNSLSPADRRSRRV